MTDTIKLRRAYKPGKVELDHGDKTLHFETVPLTRSLVKLVSDLEDEMFDASSEEDRIEKILAILDVRLQPTNGSKVKPSTIIKKLWVAEDLTYPELQGFYNAVSAGGSPN